MPFGLTDAPDSFKHFINDALQPFLDGCIRRKNEVSEARITPLYAKLPMASMPSTTPASSSIEYKTPYETLLKKPNISQVWQTYTTWSITHAVSQVGPLQTTC